MDQKEYSQGSIVPALPHGCIWALANSPRFEWRKEYPVPKRLVGLLAGSQTPHITPVIHHRARTGKQPLVRRHYFNQRRGSQVGWKALRVHLSPSHPAAGTPQIGMSMWVDHWVGAGNLFLSTYNCIYIYMHIYIKASQLGWSGRFIMIW